MLTRSCPLLLVLALATVGCNQAPRGQWVWDVGEQGPRRPSPKLLQKLQQKIKIDSQGESIERVLERWHESFGVNFEVNWTALEAAAIYRSSETHLQLTDVSLEAGIDALLEEAGGGETELGYEIKDNFIVISTLEDLSRRLVTRVYDVSDFIARGWKTRSLRDYVHTRQGRTGGATGGIEPRFPTIFGEELSGTDALTAMIVATIDPDSWTTSGGTAGTIHSYGPFLVIGQVSYNHRKIEALLQTLHSASR